MLTRLPIEQALVIALFVQIVVALALWRLAGIAWGVIFACACPLIWLLAFGLASSHLVIGFEVMWLIPALCLGWAIVANRPARAAGKPAKSGEAAHKTE